MGIMDRVRTQAEQAMVKAQQGLAQGQTKLDAMQAKRAADALLRELGAAYFALQRGGGPQERVEAALVALDQHAANHGAVDTSAASEPGQSTTDQSPSQHLPTQGDAGAVTPPPPAAGPVSPPATAGGSFSVDDV